MERTDEFDLIALKAVAGQFGLRDDAVVAAAAQLNAVKTKVYETEMPKPKAFDLLPQTSEVPAWAETYSYQVYDLVGEAKIVADEADDLPRADIQGKDVIGKVYTIGDAYGYTQRQLQAGTAPGVVDVVARKGNAARRVIESKMNSLALVGDLDYGILGFARNPFVGATVISGDWLNTATTNQQILADLNALFLAVVNQSFDNYTPNTCALPNDRLAVLYERTVTGTDTTLAGFFLNQHPGFTFIGAAELTEAGTGDAPVAIMYERNADNASIEVPQPFIQLPPQARNLELVVPCICRFAGAAVYRPLSVTYGLGV